MNKLILIGAFIGVFLLIFIREFWFYSEKRNLGNCQINKIKDNVNIQKIEDTVSNIKTKQNHDVFVSELASSIENCQESNSMCKRHRSYTTRNSKEVTEWNCLEFAAAAFFHTTRVTKDENCDVETIRSSIENDISIEIKVEDENTDEFVNTNLVGKFTDAMCYITISGATENDFHVIAAEIRDNKQFYIYNSFKNYFSNNWFSGLTKEIDDDEKSISKRFVDYKEKCGKGQRLYKEEFTACLKCIKSFFTSKENLDDDSLTFKYVCKELNEDFKKLN